MKQTCVRLALALLWLPMLQASTLSLSIDPIVECTQGFGRVIVNWASPTAVVEVRVGGPQGPSMTGLTAGIGSASTGNWVTDGTMFVLVDNHGQVEATATARVRCGGTVSSLDPGLKAGSFFPLQVGNTWVYRLDSRVSNSDYVTYTISGTEDLNGQRYYVMTSDSGGVSRLRGDGLGRIYTFTGTAAAPSETLLLDPDSVVIAPFKGALGTFPEGAAKRVPGGFETQVYVRGIGLAHSEIQSPTGSSGGFLSGMDLVEVRLDGVHLAIPAPGLSLSVENTVLDVSGKKVTNCVVPSYCAACGFINPGTYKPCAQARVDGNAARPYTLELELQDAAGRVVFKAPASAGPAGELLRYIQLELYSQANQPVPVVSTLPPGAYTLVTRLRSGVDVLATASLALRIN